MFRLFLLLVAIILVSIQIRAVNSHEEKGEWRCESRSDIRVKAEFRPGIITLDGHADDWEIIDGFEFSLLPALDPDAQNKYKGGKMIVKALHDGHDVFFMLQVDGEYVYSEGENTKCPSVGLMFQIGQNASYHRMGGCEKAPDACTRKNCTGHEVDIMHFSIGKAIPGRLYGGNLLDNILGYGGDRYGHLVDVYAWNPHCRYLDGISPSGLTLGCVIAAREIIIIVARYYLLNRYGHLVDVYAWNPHCRYLDGISPSGNDSSAQNNWRGAWWHSSLTVHSGFVEEDSPYAAANKTGTYSFEFSRPLRTMDHLQQDAQFTINNSSNISVAFWYPENGKPWHGSAHYSINCDWVPLDIISGTHTPASHKVAPRSSWNIATVFSFLFSLSAFSISIFVAIRAFAAPKTIPFTPMETL